MIMPAPSLGSDRRRSQKGARRTSKAKVNEYITTEALKIMSIVCPSSVSGSKKIESSSCHNKVGHPFYHTFCNAAEELERMSGLCFRRRVGAAADVKELEYCVALHQTVPRDNATVSSTDVRCLLASRYGLQLSHAQAGAVVRSLGGMMKHTEIDTVPSDNELWVETDSSEGENLETKLVPLASLSPSRSVGNNTTFTSDAWHPSQPTPPTDRPTEEYLDMVQLLSILLLPYLARHADEFKNGRHPPPSIRKNVGNRFTQWYWNIVHRIECWLANRWYRVYESCRPQPANVMDHAQKALLKRLNDGSAHGSSERGEGYFRQRQGRPTPAPILDEQLVESLLLEYGEVERAQNSELIRDMVAVAQTSSGRLDHAALLQAVSMDLQEWEVESEDRLRYVK